MEWPTTAARSMPSEASSARVLAASWVKENW